MGRLFTIVSTAVISSAFTSVFWLLAFNRGSETVADTPPAAAVTPRVAKRAADAVALGPNGLAIPVAGIRPASLVDTFTHARAGGARVHDAIDIMAPHGTPVVAASPGRIEKLFMSPGGGGITVYVRSFDGKWSYYYAHLQDYWPGLAEGQNVERGQPVGRVGSTGNANPSGPHLHFAVHRMAASDRFYQGEAVNPYPLLVGTPPAGR